MFAACDDVLRFYKDKHLSEILKYEHYSLKERKIIEVSDFNA